MIALGIDPGTSNAGLSVVARTASKWALLHLPALHSLDELAREVSLCLRKWQLTNVSVESVAWANHSGHQGQGSGRIIEAVGMARMAAMAADVPLSVVEPSTWRKRVTGSGKSTKEQVRSFLARTVVDWPSGVVGLNRSDATAIAIAGAMGDLKAGVRR